MAQAGIVWQGGRRPSDLARAVEDYGRRIQAAVLAAAKVIADEAETLAKQNRPWRDQTREAREGLTGVAVEIAQAAVAIYLYHQAAHGKWLEIARAGKYQVVLPTLESLYPRVFAAIHEQLR